jgi:hypothetical protein
MAKKLFKVAFAVFVMTTSFSTVSQALVSRNAFPSDTRMLQDAIRHLPEYKSLWKDRIFRRRFDRYLRWLGSPEIASDNAVYLLGEVDKGVHSFELQGHIFHEMIEFRNWMKLGHRFKDIMNRDYYNAHYSAVYPVAHCNAIIAQQRVLNAFAQSHGLKTLPMLAYDLVVPDYEKYPYLQEMTQKLGVPAMVIQLKFNREYFDEAVSEEQLLDAIEVYKEGEYGYSDTRIVLDRAKRFLKMPLTERLSALKLSQASECSPIKD